MPVRVSGQVERCEDGRERGDAKEQGRDGSVGIPEAILNLLHGATARFDERVVQLSVGLDRRRRLVDGRDHLGALGVLLCRD